MDIQLDALKRVASPNVADENYWREVGNKPLLKICGKTIPYYKAIVCREARLPRWCIYFSVSVITPDDHNRVITFECLSYEVYPDALGLRRYVIELEDLVCATDEPLNDLQRRRFGEETR